MNIWANVPVFGQSGWEVLCRNLLIALDKLGVTISLVPKSEWNIDPVDMDSEDLSRLRRMESVKFSSNVEVDLQLTQQYPSVEYLRSSLCRSSKAKKVCLSLFETDLCPRPWVPLFNAIDEVWTYSNFNKEAWEKSGVKRISVTPFGLDHNVFNPTVEPLKIKGRKSFAFIANGDLTERKWFEGLIEAFVKEFKSTEDVCLIIKTHQGGFVRRNKDMVVRNFRNCSFFFCRENAPRIFYIGEKVPTWEMGKFYRAGDCYVLASRGEGLGLPYAEALACGTPVISTRWGGQMEYLNDTNAFFVNYDLHLIDDMEYIKKCMWALNSRWATPHVQHLREMMRWVYTFSDEAKAKALKGAEDMKKLTWENAAIWTVNRVLELQGKKESFNV